ncbi:MAG: macro domain-containing protein, partial [Lachnospiraceae bacterium]|nr:macro domain-containing protein [Lachnospiraceae bacterium]
MAFKIIRNDITKVAADAIVNTANPDPEYAAGVDGAIYAAAGAKSLLAERKKIGRMSVGQAAVTPAFALDAKYIIHTVGPAWVDGEHGEFNDLRTCYENSLKLAKEYKCESIAFPLIATGVYGFPRGEALRITISVFSDFLMKEEMEIILVVFDKESFVLSDKVFSDVDSYIDEKYASEQIKEEYGSRLGRLFSDRRRGSKAASAEARRAEVEYSEAASAEVESIEFECEEA